MASASTLKPAASADQVPGSSVSTAAARKFKASDLPLTTATRTAIEGLAHSFKKQGGYDAIRKQVWEKFEASVRTSIDPSLVEEPPNILYRTTKTR